MDATGATRAGGYPPPDGQRRSQRPAARLAERDPRLHYAARWEARFNHALVAFLLRRGWHARVLGYTGYGGPGWVRVLGRVLVSRPGTGQDPDPVDQAGEPSRPARRVRVRWREDGARQLEEELRSAALEALRGWRAFMSAPVEGVGVDITVGDTVHRVVSGRGGYLDVRLPATLPAGIHTVRMDVVDVPDAVAAAQVVVVGAEQRHGVISDIDDTVMITSLPRPFIAAWNTFVLPERARRPVPGMAELLAAAAAADGGAPVVYVSTGAWNTAPVLARFMSRHGFPSGPMLLTDWGPTNTGWFRSGVEHKRDALRRLAAEFPHIRWLLVGDDGQHDPTTYADFAAAVPSAVRAIAIRQLTPTEQVLSRASLVPVGTPGSRAHQDHPGAPPAVPQVRAPDGDGLAHQLEQAGLL